MGPYEQNQHFAELRQKKLFIYTRSSAPNMFAKFGWKTRTFCHKKSGKSDCQTRVRQTIAAGGPGAA